MDVSGNAGRDLGCVFSGFAWNTSSSVDDPGRLDLVLDCAIKVQIPVESIFVVPDGQYGRDDEAACTANLGTPGAEIRMLPKEARVLLVDAHGIFYRHHRAVHRVQVRVQVFDGTQTVAAERQGIGEFASAVLADVEDVLAVVNAVV